MINLRNVYPIPKDDDPLDQSTHGFRQLLGWLGMLLPLLCVVFSAAFPTTITDGEDVILITDLSSVSAYYFTSGVSAFVGILVAMGLFLFTYKGYADKAGSWDKWVSTLAGAAAIGVAVFPTWPPHELLKPSWWTPWMAKAHLGSALILFLLFMILCLILFPGKDWRDEKGTWPHLSVSQRVWKYKVYHGCGLLIGACLIWAFVQLRRGGSIFWQEWLALWFFGIAWLRKGQVQWTLREGLLTRPIVRGFERFGNYFRGSFFGRSDEPPA